MRQWRPDLQVFSRLLLIPRSFFLSTLELPCCPEGQVALALENAPVPGSRHVQTRAVNRTRNALTQGHSLTLGLWTLTRAVRAGIRSGGLAVPACPAHGRLKGEHPKKRLICQCGKHY